MSRSAKMITTVAVICMVIPQLSQAVEPIHESQGVWPQGGKKAEFLGSCTTIGQPCQDLGPDTCCPGLECGYVNRRGVICGPNRAPGALLDVAALNADNKPPVADAAFEAVECDKFHTADACYGDHDQHQCEWHALDRLGDGYCTNGSRPASASASSFEIVSQTFKGNLTMKYSIPSGPSPTIATVEIGVDMESVRAYMNEYIVIEMPQFNITSTTKQNMIFDASTKRATTHTDSHTESPQPTPKTPATCKFFEFANLPAPAAVAKCMQDVAALAQPEASDHGLQKFKMHMPAPTAQGDDLDEVVYTDKDFVIKKLVADQSVKGAHPMTIHQEMTDMNSKAGVPDGSMFVVPTEWGNCEEQTLPPIPETNNPVMKSFLHCMGLAASQATVVV